MDWKQKLYNKSPIFFQTIILNLKASELYLERYGSKFWKTYRTFDQIQWLSESQVEEYQFEKLKALINYSYENVPYYSRIMKERSLTPKDIKNLEDLSKFPVLTRDTVRLHQKELLSTKYPKLLLRHGHTSGTTGSPLEFYYDISTCVVHHVADWRQKHWAGLQNGEPYGSLQGRVIVPLTQKTPPFWRKNWINNQLFLSAFNLSKQNLPRYFEKIYKDGLSAIEGYPSNLYILSLYLNEHKTKLPVKAILTSSETLFDYQRESIEKAFECKVFDFYGMAERVVFATECDYHKGHHLNMDYGVTEFLDNKNEPVGPGKMGRLVATSLHNYAMPFIRYQTNDVSGLKAEKCPCGRSFPLMQDVTTKDESIVTLPDGRLVSPSVLTHPFKPMHNISESQIIQTELDQLLVKVVKRNSYTRKDEIKLLRAFQERLGSQVNIKIEYVDSIPRTDSGKLKWVISHVTPHF